MKRSRTAMIIGLLLTGMTCAHAQKMSISSPSSIETYAKDREYIGVTNEGIQALTGSLTLVLDDATQPISLGTVSVPENSSVRLPLDFPDTKTLRDHLKTPRPSWWGAMNVFRGQVVLSGSGEKKGENGESAQVNLIQTLPITLYGLGHLIAFSNFWSEPN